jgi:hypothetical protein
MLQIAARIMDCTRRVSEEDLQAMAMYVLLEDSEHDVDAPTNRIDFGGDTINETWVARHLPP